MNVTTSANWNRPAVGIVRVEQSLSLELSEIYGKQLKFCVWENNRFVELKEDLTSDSTARRDNNHAPQREENQQTDWIYPLVPKKQAIINITQGLLSLTPGPAKALLNNVLKQVRPRTLRLINSRLVRRILSHKNKKPVFHEKNAASPSPFDRCPPAPFSQNDILISLGLEWEHNAYQNYYYLRKDKGLKIITCCYDLIPVLYPQYCVSDVGRKFMAYFIDLANGSDHILCISKQTQRDLRTMLEHVGGAMVDTSVFPMGDNVPISSPKPPSDLVKQTLKRPFILFVSTIERRKNHEVLYRAYHLLCKAGYSNLPKLVFVGMQGWGVGELLQDIQLDPITKEHIIMLNNVTDSELTSLYESSLFCVFPSLYEGWGLPVSEALSKGKVVLCSDRGSLPEVGGDLVRYIDPWNAQAWADEIYRMATDNEFRNSLEHNIRLNYKIKTWANSAKHITRIVDTLL